MTEKKNKVFIATSLDGFIADKDQGIEWLNSFPEINEVDTGYEAFISKIDALVMGRTTFETVLNFGIEWPYKKPVFVLSNRLKKVPDELSGSVQLVRGTLDEILKQIHNQGHHNLYIDGGKTIQSFLKEELIDEMVITTIPILLGSGIPLFGELSKPLKFKCIETTLFFDKVVQNRFLRFEN
ncbi:MAG: dihydrofolate reductase [Balneola sp.]|nr:dihydrofolate reductase [Balneola sp.]MBO6650448.1 dihydrofolate reductase [Balneola sp.]MBO6710156.1 dihydrofolate reductase [Balneola sp.]MBO6798840.1 dihydrofolate reductase [Balneola sp.]MBO6869954.1 dihydrofolate reductase [Balneola sp.]